MRHTRCAQQQAEQHRPGVAHEDACRVPVVHEEADGQPDRDDGEKRRARQQAARRTATTQCVQQERGCTDAGHAGREPVEPVDQVDDVDEGDEEDHRQHEPEVVRERDDPYTGEPEVLQLQPERGDQCRGDELTGELERGGQVEQVVEHAEHDEGRGPDEEPDRFARRREHLGERLAGRGERERGDQSTEHGESAEDRHAGGTTSGGRPLT